MANDPILEALEADRRTLVVRLSRKAIREIEGKPPGAYWIGEALVVISEDDRPDDYGDPSDYIDDPRVRRICGDE